ncbi:hypothetical protein VARIO8X_70107 [Burkholderiales bacterium 8X]|nr:hypothetical protein VARIO8X_70107 [Burkholderiales bacterium 8X]
MTKSATLLHRFEGGSNAVPAASDTGRAARLTPAVCQVFGSILLGLAIGGGALGCSHSAWWAVPAFFLIWPALWLISGDCDWRHGTRVE